MPLNHFTGKNVWILKPTSYNRGKGIHVVSDFKKVKKLMKEYSSWRDAMPAMTPVVPVRNQSMAPSQTTVISSTKMPWNYNSMKAVKPIASKTITRGMITNPA